MRAINVFILAACVTMVCFAQEPLNGKFTVNAQGAQVQFAPGNLQYVPSTNTWQFAESQTDIIGKGAEYVTDTIDLFPWASTYGSYIGTGWRLLTDEEWQYLLREEEIGKGSSYAGQATIGGTQHGLMLVPDGWKESATLTFKPSANNWTTNSYTTANWEQLKTSGVVFLPCAEETGMYWSATPDGQSFAYCMNFSVESIAANTQASRDASFSVRLVKDVKETPTDVEEINNYELKISNKILRDGMLLIVRDNKLYNAQGVEVR